MRRLAAVAGVAAALLSALVALAAGGGRATGWAVAACALLAALGALALFAGDAAGGAPRGRAVVLLALGIAAWGALGALPLPGALLQRVAPRREAVQRAIPRGEHGIGTWAQAVTPQGRSLSSALAGASPAAPDLAPRLGPPVAAPASYAPWATRRAAAVLLGFLLLLAALGGRDGERPALAVVAGCSTIAVAVALAGLWSSRATPGLLFGRFEPPPGSVTQPYGLWSGNHAAALLALTCPVLFACVLDGARRIATRVLAALALAPVAVALVDDGSRGGLLFGAAGAVALGGFLLRIPGRRAVGAALVASAVAGLVLAFTVFAPRILHESLEQTTALRGSNLERSELYALQGRMAKASPLLGTGLGAFRTAQGVFRESPDSMVPLHGESDWLETLVEGGVPAVILWSALVAAVLGRPLLRAVRGRAPVLLAGLVAGSLACLLHASVDFHLREPLVALAAIAAAAAACAWDARLTHEEGGAALRPQRLPWLPVAAALGSALVLALAARREIPRDRAFREAERLAAAGSADAAAEAAARAAAAAPRDGDAWALLGFAEEQRAQAARPGRERSERRAAAVAASVRAIETSPAAFGAARRCASLLLQAGAEEEAVEATRLALAVSRGSGATRRVAGQLLLRHGPSADALEHLGFAFRALPATRIHHESRAIAAWMLEAAGGDAVAAMRVAGGTDRVAWFVSELVRLGRAEEVAACLRALASDPGGADVDPLATLALVAEGEDAAAFTRALAPSARSPLARQRFGIALVRGGDAEAGAALIRGAHEDGSDAPESWLALGDAELEAGRKDAARAAWSAGLARHPGSSALKARLADPVE